MMHSFNYHVFAFLATLDNAYLKGYLSALQKPVLYEIVGAPAQLLYRTMVMCATNCDAREDVQK